MKTAARKGFTMIEVMMTIGIILILAALLFPALNQAKTQARFTRWKAFNEMVNGDPDCVVNFNFQSKDSRLVSRAEGCDTSDFMREAYDGILNGDFAWTDGRWPKLKRALMFNGSDTYVVMEGGTANNFAGEGSFTITCWVRFDNLDQINTLISKVNSGATQYELFAADSQIGAILFGEELSVGSSDIEKDKWVHLALQFNMGNQVADASTVKDYAMATGEIRFGISHVIYRLADGTTVKIDEYPGDVKDSTDPQQYVAGIQQMYGQEVEGYTIKAARVHYDEDGNQVPDIPNQADNTIFTTDVPEVVAGGGDEGGGEEPVVPDEDPGEAPAPAGDGNGIMVVYINGKAIGNKAVNFDPAVFQGASPMIIGAEDNGGGKTNLLSGRIDEMIITKRALPAAEIKAHYEMGAGL
ncbi:MAG: prepilin-type N-terminal cleavage/methylation domain-containing protein [Victivallales bacterium]|nr:prepilin-type N-terminal cleavage/methylation domain-containing protein [Victivallales bacterium]